MKNIIEIYDNDILELPLVVGISQSVEDLKDKYEYSDGKPIDENLIDSPGSCCILKDKQLGTIVMYVGLNRIPVYVKNRSKEEQIFWIVNTIGHECYHAFMNSMDIINDTPSIEHQELGAYYMGWLVECVYKTWVKSTKSPRTNAKQ